MPKTRFMRDMLANPACATLGHSWVVRVRSGRLIETCSACGAVPTPTPTPTNAEEN